MTKGLVTVDSGPLWKELRRSFHAYLSKSAVQQYKDAIEREGKDFALRVLDGVNGPLDGVRLLVNWLTAHGDIADVFRFFVRRKFKPLC